VKVRVSWSMMAALIAVSLAAGMAFGALPSRHHSSQKSARFEIVETMKIPGGPTLRPGNYKLALLNNSSTPEVRFYEAGKLLGQAPVKLIDQGKKSDETEVFSDTGKNRTHVLTEIDPSGWTEKLMFGAPRAGGGPGQ
jgi:hypothetical protein